MAELPITSFGAATMGTRGPGSRRGDFPTRLTSKPCKRGNDFGQYRPTGRGPDMLRIWNAGTGTEVRQVVVADPDTHEACYFINPDGSVNWRNVDRNTNKSFPGIYAKAISVGANGRVWAIQTNGVWARHAPEYNRWDVYSESRLDIAADPRDTSSCYFINPDYSVQWRNVDASQNASFPGVQAKRLSAGPENSLW